MKKINLILSAAFGILAMVACNPYTPKKMTLGAPPTASFTITEGTEMNTYTLKSTSTDAFLYKWDLGNGTTGDGESVDVFYQFAGEYTVKLTALGEGGSDTIVKTITVAEDAPLPCTGIALALTGCGSKKWKLAPEANALWVASDINASVWFGWGNGAADVNARSCLFNDTYTFNADGTVTYDDTDDLWADTDNNGNVTPADLGLNPGCNAAADWPAAYADWMGGQFQFSITDSVLTLIGSGAHLGLYKVANGQEVTTPQPSISYNILSITDERMVVWVDFGVGVWRFTYVAVP